MELSPPHTPASGTGARTHPASLKEEQEGGRQLRAEFTGSVLRMRLKTVGKKRVHRNLPPSGVLARGVPTGKGGALWLERDSIPEGTLRGFTQLASVSQLCPTLCDPMDCSPPGYSVLGPLQAGILEWVAISFSRGSSRPRT